ncbi:hypothetical protein EZV62_012074 [Acer yangbiense]|uniref:Endonuclease/exonuclease/phosphatase domain-containing protein n=1 Tax=Acer yangbiense TaxID=1000413 RepID=A0A5C7I700_9ROSI|nr:hypothetical protein EZV62_012074 [Acer yangbiense]
MRSVDDLPWLCGGDFNEILKVEEKSGGSDKSILGICQFREVIDDCNLVDLGFEGSKMTWNNRRDRDNNVQERIDRMLADTAWIDLFPGARVQHLGYNSYDHRPLLLSFADGFRGARKTDRKPFKFEPFWLKEECFEVIREAWNSLEVPHSLGDLERKLVFCAGKLSFWSLAKFDSLRKRIEEKQKEVKELLSRAQIKGTMSLHFIARFLAETGIAPTQLAPNSYRILIRHNFSKNSVPRHFFNLEIWNRSPFGMSKRETVQVVMAATQSWEDRDRHSLLVERELMELGLFPAISGLRRHLYDIDISAGDCAEKAKALDKLS